MMSGASSKKTSFSSIFPFFSADRYTRPKYFVRDLNLLYNLKVLTMDIPDYGPSSDEEEEKVKVNKGTGKGEFGANLTGWNELFLKD